MAKKGRRQEKKEIEAIWVKYEEKLKKLEEWEDDGTKEAKARKRYLRITSNKLKDEYCNRAIAFMKSAPSKTPKDKSKE